MISLPNFSNVSVLVAGDVMLDKYWTGETRRISQEAPVPVVNIDDWQYKAGGAANVALNLAALGCGVCLFGITGNDTRGKTLQTIVEQHGVASHLCVYESVQTTTNLRVMSGHQQLMRLDFEDDMTVLDKHAFNSEIISHMTDIDAVILSDYSKGALSAVEELIYHARLMKIPVLVDPKGSDYSRYTGADVITPNRKELAIATGADSHVSSLIMAAKALVSELGIGAVLLTQSEEGMTLIRPDYEPFHIHTQAKEVFDVTGAGDTVIATLGACLGAKMDIASGCQLANYAAGIVVGKLNTATITPLELLASLD